MEYIIEKQLQEEIKRYEKEEKIVFGKGGTEQLLLLLLRKEDSLLNCLCKLKFQEVKKYISQNEITADEKFNLILEEAMEIANKDNEEAITDEHILYALLKDGDNNAIDILESFSINTSLMLITVDEYLEFTENNYLINLTQEVKNKKVNPFIGRTEYIDKVVRILSKKQKNNCMLIGSAGVGKSALVEGVAEKFIKEGRDETIYRLEIGSLIAGTRYRGDLEERVNEVIDEIKEKKAILFIDEIHMVTSSSRSEDTLSIGNMLKPILSRSGIKCIGATTTEEYYEYIERDKAFARRFQTIFIPEPNTEETKIILQGIKEGYEKYYNIKYTEEIIDKIISYARFFPNRKFPDKAIDILDEVGALIKSNHKENIKEEDIKRIVLENIGIKRKSSYKTNNKITCDVNNIYKDFINISKEKKIIALFKVNEEKEEIIKEIYQRFGLNEESLINIDLEFLDDYSYNFLLSEVLKNPISIIVIENYDNAQFINQRKIQNIITSGIAYDSKGRKISFRNAIFILGKNNDKKIGY